MENNNKWVAPEYIDTANVFTDKNAEKWFAGLIDNYGSEYIKPCLVLGETREQVKERASLIVKAVNEYDELIKQRTALAWDVNRLAIDNKELREALEDMTFIAGVHESDHQMTEEYINKIDRAMKLLNNK